MAKWVNLNRNNRSVIVHRYSALSEKARPMLLPLVGLTAGGPAGWQVGRQAGRQAGKQPGWLVDEVWVDFEKILKILYRPNYLYFYFV